MNEQERADALARAIDELIHRRGEHDQDFEDEDLRSLLRVAGARHETGAERAHTAANHEAAVWQRLVTRMEDRSDSDQPEQLAPDDDVRGVIAARRQVTEEVLALADQHRDEVWNRVQERISKQRPGRRGIFSFLRSHGYVISQTETPPASRTRLIPTGDSELDSLLRVALGLTSLRAAGERALSGQQAQLQQRVRLDPARRRPAPAATPRHEPMFWLRAGAVAAAVLVAAALLPIPGLAHSPAVEAARFLGQHLGVVETNESPPAPGASTTVQGEDMTVADAATQLSLPLSAPEQLMSLALKSQRFFATGVTSSGAGSFVATYASADGNSALAVYEEAAGGSDFAVPAGGAVDVTVGGAPATYFEGGWSSDNGGLTWQPDGSQTLIFERDGVRFVMQYTGPRIDPSGLAAAAETLAPAQ